LDRGSGRLQAKNGVLFVKPVFIILIYNRLDNKESPLRFFLKTFAWRHFSGFLLPASNLDEKISQAVLVKRAFKLQRIRQEDAFVMVIGLFKKAFSYNVDALRLDLAFALVNDVVKKNRLEEKQDLV
jgi:hypothetical protein